MSVYEYDSEQKKLNPIAGSSTDMIGATSSIDGEHGLVPKPLAGEENLFLRGDGRFAKAAADDNFVGTVEEWEALTLAERTQYKTVDLIDEYQSGIELSVINGKINISYYKEVV